MYSQHNDTHYQYINALQLTSSLRLVLRTIPGMTDNSHATTLEYFVEWLLTTPLVVTTMDFFQMMHT